MILIDTIYIPDSIFWVMYFALYWQVLNLFYAGHMESGNLLVITSSFDPLSPNNLNRLLYILFVYTIGQTVIIVMFNVNQFYTGIMIIINIALNASIPVSLVISEVYLNFRFSGSPFRSKSYEKVTGTNYDERRITQQTNRIHGDHAVRVTSTELTALNIHGNFIR
jgi:hypothetical protein